jgi:adenylate cyclase
MRISMSIALCVALLHGWGELAKTKANYEPNWLQRMELAALDSMFTHRGLQPPERWQVGIAAIDEKSIKELGELPWSRRVHARLVRKLSKLGASSIAFDVMFNYPQTRHDDRGIAAARTSAVSSGLYDAREDLRSAEKFLSVSKRSSERIQDSELRAQFEATFDRSLASIHSATTAIERFRSALDQQIDRVNPDEDFTAAMAESGRVVLAVVQHSQEEAARMKPETLNVGMTSVGSATIAEFMVQGEGFNSIGQDAKAHFESHYIRFFGVQAPTNVLLNPNSHLGTINAFPDSDGVMRRFYLLARPGESAFVLPTLALKAVEVSRPDVLIEIVSASEGGAPFALDVGETRIELGDRASALVNWYGPPAETGLPVWSISDLLNDKVSAEDIGGRVVFVAATALGTFDQRVTPLDRNIPGIYIHATLAQNILDGKFLSRTGAMFFLEVLVLLLLGFLLGLGLTRLGVGGKLALALGAGIGWWLINRFVFFDQGLIVSTVVPISQVFVTLLIMTLWRFLIEEREKQKTKQAFQSYLAPAVMEQVLTNPDEFLRLGGRKYEATVLFSDIRGFTTISERLSPEDLGRLLNLYMTPMTDLVFETGGTLDKYIGDAVMAFWGAPIIQDDHAARACQTALRMMKKVGELNVEFAAEGLPEIAIGIGLASGEMTIGNMGSTNFFAYTALGDRVNLGARLEGQTKDYGVEIIISEDCYLRSKSTMSCRELGSIQVKGKRQPVRIYELLAEGPLTGEMAAFVDDFHAGLGAYRAKQWGDAMRYFERAHALRVGGDKTSLDYIEQCRAFERNPPPENWDGVRVALTK